MFLKCLEAWGTLLLARDVCVVRHFFPLQAHFIHINPFNSTRRTLCQVNKVKIIGLGRNISYLA